MIIKKETEFWKDYPKHMFSLLISKNKILYKKPCKTSLVEKKTKKPCTKILMIMIMMNKIAVATILLTILTAIAREIIQTFTIC